MPIHSVLPPEAYGAPEDRPACRCLPCRWGLADCLPLPDGSWQVERLISTDPAAYLDPEAAPGSVLPGDSPFFLRRPQGG